MKLHNINHVFWRELRHAWLKVLKFAKMTDKYVQAKMDERIACYPMGKRRILQLSVKERAAACKKSLCLYGFQLPEDGIAEYRATYTVSDNRLLVVAVVETLLGRSGVT